MPTRYQQLRHAVATLAAEAEAQARHLDESFSSLTGGRSAAGYGNDELALEFDSIFCAANDMIDGGELTQAEKDVIQPLHDMLMQWSGQANAAFWGRDALVRDPRWERVRTCAARIVARLPDEERAIGRSG